MTGQWWRDYLTVRKFISELVDKGMTEAEQQERLGILAKFLLLRRQTPDQMMAEVFDVATQKYRKRNFYSDQVKAFASQISGTRSVQTARGNVIRSFFIANGRRLSSTKSRTGYSREHVRAESERLRDGDLRRAGCAMARKASRPYRLLAARDRAKARNPDAALRRIGRLTGEPG